MCPFEGLCNPFGTGIILETFFSRIFGSKTARSICVPVFLTLMHCLCALKKISRVHLACLQNILLCSLVEEGTRVFEWEFVCFDWFSLKIKNAGLDQPIISWILSSRLLAL